MVFTLSFLAYGLIQLPQRSLSNLTKIDSKNYYDREDKFEMSKHTSADSEMVIAFEATEMMRSVGNFSVHVYED